MDIKRLQVDLSEQEHADLERLAERAGLKTKRELVLNALTLFKWAATELTNGRQVASVAPDGTMVKQLEMPSLTPFARIAERLDAATPSAAVLEARANRADRSARDLIAELRRKLEEFSHAPADRQVLVAGG